MTLKGKVSDLRKLRERIQDAPRFVAHEVAKRSAPDMTRQTRSAFASGKTVYGAPRPAGVDGRALTLKDTGDALASLKFSANGTIIRSVVAVKYAKFLIGKYKVLPMGKLPVAWQAELAGRVAEVKALP